MKNKIQIGETLQIAEWVKIMHIIEEFNIKNLAIIKNLQECTLKYCRKPRKNKINTKKCLRKYCKNQTKNMNKIMKELWTELDKFLPEKEKKKDKSTNK
jgi:hypothetical protein